ncbi:hypothetical protein HMPREF3192_00039 [Atopobium deltae]|uniref:Uncharacterized protein n=1 Tax=Atopobium deltae TaxID=1393034 RepID=A0A133XXJ9_9ACTN|nr:hypothetical protein HMPREF3192_00039 [Atopobium deltae]
MKNYTKISLFYARATEILVCKNTAVLDQIGVNFCKFSRERQKFDLF